MKTWFSWFENNLNIPEPIVRQFLMKKLAEGFDYRGRKGFKTRLLLRAMPKAIPIYFGYLLFIINSKQRRSIKLRNFDLIIDHIESLENLNKYRTLISTFRPENIVVVGTPSVEDLNLSAPEVLILNPPRYRQYRISYFEAWSIMKGVLLHVTCSLRLGVNLIYLAMRIIDSFLYYRTLFDHINGKYMINHQHYHTDAIKNYLFKDSGGIVSGVIQKNVHSFGPNGFFYDADVFFSIGKKTITSAFRLGARIRHVEPVGSFFYEATSYTHNPSDTDLWWHVVDIGGGGHATPEILNYTDTYEGVLDDYLKHLEWLLDLSSSYPDLRVAYKLHPSDLGELEYNFFRESAVTVIASAENTYEHAFHSAINVTWASTVVLEMRGHGRLAFFLNPGNRNDQHVTSQFRHLSLSTYQQFEEIALKYRDAIEIPRLDYLDSDACVSDKRVAKRIYDYCVNKIN